MKDNIVKDFPFLPNVQSTTNNYLQAYFNRTWKSQMEIIGAEGLPEGKTAGNVLRPFTSVRFSIRLPPTLDSKQAGDAVKKALEKDPPYQSKVDAQIKVTSNGWEAPANQKLVLDSLQKSCTSIFKKDLYFMGDGMTIPLLNKFSAKWPKAEFIVTGVLGPQSNAHGSNEMLHLPYTKQLTCCVSKLLADLAGQN